MERIVLSLFKIIIVFICQTFVKSAMSFINRQTALLFGLLIPSCILVPAFGVAAEINIAVASNFSDTMKNISRRFETKTGHKVKLIIGSTGKHYAQIKNGAPFDLLFAADTRRPQLLEAEGPAIKGSRFTYAIGQLVLWSPQSGYVDKEAKILMRGDFRRLAIANPKLAPYGQAAAEVLQSRQVWQKLRPRLVQGENISQTYQFIKTGNAELGFIAYAQLKHENKPMTGSVWLVPQNLYTPIQQQAVLLKENQTAREFVNFMRSNEILDIIQQAGYNLP